MALAPSAIRRLLDYLGLLARWNRVYNLTAIRSPAGMVTHHLLDSLAILPLIEDLSLVEGDCPAAGLRMADVGSGAGLPGIPVAIACPALQVTLIESSHKKAAFLVHAKAELALANVVVERQRVEAWAPPKPFDVVTSRAFAGLPEFLRLAGHLARPGGWILAMKGAFPTEELRHLPGDYTVERVVALSVPALDAARHAVVLRKGGQSMEESVSMPVGRR